MLQSTWINKVLTVIDRDVIVAFSLEVFGRITSPTVCDNQSSWFHVSLDDVSEDRPAANEDPF